MKKYISSFFLLLSFIELTHQAVELGYVYTSGRGYGDYSPKILAEPELGNNLGDYYVCGLDFLESSWVVNLDVCLCKKRWYSGRRRVRCLGCDQWFWTQTNSARVRYCHKDKWEVQKTQVFSTGKKETQNWRQITCPKGQYATGIATRSGYQHNVDLALNGAKLRCENTNFTQKSQVQDGYTYELAAMSTNPAKTFITAFQFRHVKYGILTGLKAYFGQDIKPASVNISYGKVELLGESSTKTIESVQKENRDVQSISYTIEFKNIYLTSGSWTNDVDAMNIMQLPEGTMLKPPILDGTKLSDNVYYKATNSPFQFKAIQTTTYTPSITVPTTIPWCYVQKGISVVDEQKVRVPYTLTLKYVSPTTNEALTRTVTGVYEGLVYKPIQTDTSNSLIPGCRDE